MSTTGPAPGAQQRSAQHESGPASAAALVVVVLGVAAHPGSGRRVVPHSDMAALALALELGGPLLALHAGDPAEPALRQCLGLGLPSITVLQQPRGELAGTTIAEHLRSLQVSLVLTGARAGGSMDGMLPYTLSTALGTPMVRDVRAIVREPQGWLVDTHLGLGRSRRLRCRGPLVATLDVRAQTRRFPTYGAARQGRIEVVQGATAPSDAGAPVLERPARTRPVTLEPIRGAHFSHRFEAIADRPRSITQIRKGLPADVAAGEILQLLRAHRVGACTRDDLDRTP